MDEPVDDHAVGPGAIKYVGGGQDLLAPPSNIVWAVRIIGSLAVLVIIVAALYFSFWGAHPLTKPIATPAPTSTYNGQPEPGATARFMAALRAHDPVGMRAEITPACVADTASSLCFDSSSDTTFQAGLKDKVITYTFVASWSGDGPFKVAVYRMNVVGGGEYTMNFVLSPEGKILRAALMGVKPV